MVFLLSLYLELSIAIILWLLVSFLLGMLLSYLLGAKTRDKVLILEKDLSAMTAKANSLEADLSTAKYEKEKTAEELAKEKSNNADLYFKLKACEESKAALEAEESEGSEEPEEAEESEKPSGSEEPGGFEEPENSHGNVENVKAASTSFAATTVPVDHSKSDDLKIVDGIGPKIEMLLKNAGIKSFAVLARSETDAIKVILENGGGRYRLADPTTWPKQAQMAAEGQWNQLDEYKKSLKNEN